MRRALVLAAVGCLTVLGQGFGQREMMQLWMQGRFAEAELNFIKVAPGTIPTLREYFLSWRADYEIERARYGVAAALLEEAKQFRTPNTESQRLLERRLARLYSSVGRFADAEKMALTGYRWKGDDIRKLSLSSETNLVTLGEVYIARGKFALAIQILEKACAEAKKSWKTGSPEWIRAQNGIAIANLGLGQTPAASQAASQALATAEKEWGSGGVPTLDALDMIGLVRVYESKFQDAAAALSQSLKLREALYGGQHPKVGASYRHAALLSAAQMDNDSAVQLMTRGLQIERSVAVDGPNAWWALSLLEGADLFARIGRIDEAEQYYTTAIPILELELGPDAPRLEDARKRSASLLRQ
jgi:tetratricopeptide (TPR) repeat protein